MLVDCLARLLKREGQSIALVLLGGVQYLTGQLFDIKTITAAAQAQGEPGVSIWMRPMMTEMRPMMTYGTPVRVKN
jgi:hypothetical protein